MLKRILILFLFCFANLQAFAQEKNYAAPVKWEKYKVGSQGVSVLMPRLPVMISTSEACNGKDTVEYAAYSDQIVYGLTITSKRKNPDFCTRVRGSKEFSDQSFRERLDEIRINFPQSEEAVFKQNELNIVEVSGGSTKYWLVNDAKAEKWVEVWIIGGNEEKTEVKNFVKSIELSKVPPGVEIGNGAERTFGDEFVKKSETETDEKTPIVIALKPPPKYTDKARENEAMGVVILKVIFLSNGAIGDIVPASGLPFGLTEEAIKAAQKIVFIPPRRNGISYSVSKAISYSFTIY